jgi:pimeloyl-ACP methyl ester carboxylesterase
VTRIAFLPGAGGQRAFWAPVAERLGLGEDALIFAWPGFGDEPPDPAIRRLSDLATLCIERLDGPTDLVAQSMGGVIALQVALARPDLVRRLVLCGTSGGIGLRRFQAQDWRRDYDLPKGAPRYFVDDDTDIEASIPGMGQQTLLLWGANDSVVGPVVGERFAALLPNARLVIIEGAGHALAMEKPDQVASHIAAFLDIEVTA